MNKFVITAIAAATIGFSALAVAPASAAVSTDPIVKTETASVQKNTSNLIKVARRGGRHGGFRGRGFRHGGRFHRRHRWGHRWGGFHRAYWGGCYTRRIWTNWGPVWKRFCHY